MFALWSGVAISLHEVLQAKNVIFPVSMRKPWISYGSCQCNEHEQTSNHNFHCGPNGMVLICELYPMRNSHAWPNLLLHVAGSGLKMGSQPAKKNKTGPDSSGARGAFFHCSDLLVSSPFCSNCLLRDLATLATLAQLSTPRKEKHVFSVHRQIIHFRHQCDIAIWAGGSWTRRAAMESHYCNPCVFVATKTGCRKGDQQLDERDGKISRITGESPDLPCEGMGFPTILSGWSSCFTFSCSLVN